MITQPLIIEIEDGRFGKIVLTIDPKYVIRMAPETAKKDREFLDICITAQILQALSIVTSEVPLAQREELKMLAINELMKVCDITQKKRREMKKNIQRPT